MACVETTPCTPCNPDYTELGCPDYPKTGCVIYDGEDIPCLSITKTENLNEILEHLQTVICNLAPTAYENFDYGCFSGQGINTEQEFVEFISATLCEVLGTQIPGGITSLSTLNTAIQSNLTNINLIKNQTVISCFQTLASLTATENISALLLAIQTIICDLNDRVTSLEVSGGLALTANDSTTIDFTTSGTLNHTLTGSVKLSATANNALTADTTGVHVLSPVISPTDTDEINLTVSGIHNHTLQANLNLSTTIGNRLSIQPDGLLATQVALLPTDSSTIDFTLVDSATNQFTGSVIIDPNPSNVLTASGAGLFVNGSSLTLANNSVTNAILRDSAAYSVIGRTSGTTGDPADIQANSNEVLRRSGTGNLAFGTLVTGNLGNDQVTFAKIQNLAGQRLVGNASPTSGDMHEIAIGAGLILDNTTDVLMTSGSVLLGISTFYSSGVWNKPIGCNKVIVECLGGQGGGGGCLGAVANASCGAGGGGGAYMVNYITSGLGATETVTIGAGGTGGVPGDAADGRGGTGGNTLFGAHIQANGGAGGDGMDANTTPLTSTGGNAGVIGVTSGLFIKGSQVNGDPGLRISGTIAIAGRGGHYINGSSGGVINQSGNGSYGTGAVSLDGNDYSGGAGIPGMVIVYEYS